MRLAVRASNEAAKPVMRKPRLMSQFSGARRRRCAGAAPLHYSAAPFGDLGDLFLVRFELTERLSEVGLQLRHLTRVDLRIDQDVAGIGEYAARPQGSGPVAWRQAIQVCWRQSMLPQRHVKKRHHETQPKQ